MRYLFLVLFALPITATAQSTTDPVAKSRWHLSFSVFPGVDRNVFSTAYVTAADTIARQPVAVGNRTFLPRRESDTLRLDGMDKVYFSEATLSEDTEAETPRVNLAFQVKAHYRFPNGIEISAGLYYGSYTISHRRADADRLPADAFYSIRNVRKLRAGFASAASYHFLRSRRVQPYLGLRMTNLIAHSRTYNSQLISADRPEVFDRPFNPRFANNTIFDFDLDAFAGLSYQFSGTFNVGIELRLPLNNRPIPEPTNLILRYQLGRKKTGL